MRFRDTFRTALKGVTVNLSRSALTMLGIIIGVGSVVLMSSVGQSIQGVILSQISSLGPKSMVIFPGPEGLGPQGVTTGFDSLTFEDLSEIRKLKSITTVAPVIFVVAVTSYGNEEGNPRIVGATPEFFENQKLSASMGRLIDQEDLDGAKKVAILGSDALEKFFGSVSPLGQRIKIGETYYTVVGAMDPVGSQFGQNVDDRILIPFTVAKNVSGQKYLNLITLQAVDSFDLAFDDIRTLLRYRHGISNPENDEKKDDFMVHSSEQANRILGSVSLGLTMFITTVAAISLIVGGIGIMNIMLVTVKERTQEIGLRKAIGGRKRDILLQFLSESVMLTVIGGIIGMVLGVFLAFVISGIVRNYLSSYAFAVSVQSMVAAFFMALFTGIVFGISPARAAANLHPIEALRYE